MLVLLAVAGLWSTALAGLPVFLPLAAGLAALAFGRGFHGQSRAILVTGSLLLVALVAKDLWPADLPWIEAWSTAAGLPPGGWRPVRNPQTWNLLAQAGGIAAAVLGIAALHSLRARGLVTRSSVVSGLAVLLLLWTTAIALLIDPARPYGEGNFLLAVRSKNSAATLVGIGAALALGLARRGQERREFFSVVLWLAALVFSVGILLRLRSLTGVVGFAAAAFLIVGHALGRNRPGAGHWIWAGLVAVLGFLLAATLSPAFAARLDKLSQDFRLEIWSDCIALLRPMLGGGTGLGSFEHTYPLLSSLALPPNTRLVHPDSSWVLLTVEWGVILVLMLVIALGWMDSWNRPGASPGVSGEADDPVMIVTARAGTLAWLTCGLTDISLHRPETALIGCGLLALLPRRPGQRARGVGMPALALGLCLTAAFAGYFAQAAQTRALSSPGFAARDLRSDPLNPALHLQAARAAWNEEGDVDRALAHFRAAVALEHASMRYPEDIARLLTTRRPEEAVVFWGLVFKRGQANLGWSLESLDRAMAEFPGQSPAFWEEAVMAGNPDLRLVLARHPQADTRRLLAAWMAEGDPRCLHQEPRLVGALFEALQRIPAEGGIVRTLLDRAPRDLPREVHVRSIRVLEAAGDPARAWAVASAIEPFASIRGVPEELAGDPRHFSLARLVTTTGARGPVAKLRLLEEITQRSGVPAWFRLELARTQHAAGRETDALATLLALLEGDPSS